MQIPFVTGSLSVSGAVAATSGTVEDDDTGFGDITITPIIGWHAGNLHYSTSLSIFVPIGEYDTATVDVPGRSINNALNFGTNRFAFDPAFAMTYLSKETGLEVSGSVGVTLSLENRKTDYQTAPELHAEGAVLQHLPSGLAFGVSAYAYQQLGEDSGSGAESFKDSVGAKSLKARVFGAGPILTYSAKIANLPMSLKLKYVHEFGAKRRFESEVLWGTVGVSF